MLSPCNEVTAARITASRSTSWAQCSGEQLLLPWHTRSCLKLRQRTPPRRPLYSAIYVAWHFVVQFEMLGISTMDRSGYQFLMQVLQFRKHPLVCGRTDTADLKQHRFCWALEIPNLSDLDQEWLLPCTATRELNQLHTFWICGNLYMGRQQRRRSERILVGD